MAKYITYNKIKGKKYQQTTSNNSIEVFRTKNDLFDYYGGALGDCNNVKRVDLNAK